MNSKILVKRIAQLLFFAAVGVANWYKAEDSGDTFYQVVMIVCVVGFLAVLLSIYFSWRKDKA